MESNPILERRLVEQARTEFDRLRWIGKPIKATLIHRATNAKVEGVRGTPTSLNSFIAMHGAGHREPGPVYDSNGNLKLREDPILDFKGKPIIDEQGRPIDFVMPATRSIFFSGGDGQFAILKTIIVRAGKSISQSRMSVLELLAGWRFSNWEDLWCDFVFELALAEKSPLLTAEKRLWLPADEPSVFVPYDLRQLNDLATEEFGGQLHIPTNWLQRLPDAWVSEIDDFVVASIDAADYILTELQPVLSEREAHNAQVMQNSSTETGVTEPSTEVRIQRRFAIALSFPGEHRDFVSEVASNLSNALGEHRILYDKFHEAEFARPDLDLMLEELYRDQSDLIVVFLCRKYEEKDWCRLEWRVVREMIKRRRNEDVMLLRIDEGDVQGMSSLHGYTSIEKKSPREVTDLILKRWSTSL